VTETAFGFRPYIMLVAAALLYGLMFSFNKVAADAGITPFAYTFWQSLLAGLILLGYCAVRRSLPGTAMANLRAYGVIGTLAVRLPIALLTYTASHLPAGVLTLVLALSPPFTYGFGVLLRLDRLSWFGVLGILFGFAGVTVLVAPTASLPDPGASGWFMLSLLASVMFAGANVLQRCCDRRLRTLWRWLAERCLAPPWCRSYYWL
jgi:drug/metabolite transporter (DMT)-like permease